MKDQESIQMNLSAFHNMNELFRSRPSSVDVSNRMFPIDPRRHCAGARSGCGCTRQRN